MLQVGANTLGEQIIARGSQALISIYKSDLVIDIFFKSMKWQLQCISFAFAFKYEYY